MKDKAHKCYRKYFLYSILLGITVVITIFSFKPRDFLEKKQVLSIALPFDIRSLDLASAHDNNSSHVMNMIFEGLMRRDAHDIPKPAIAKSFDVS